MRDDPHRRYRRSPLVAGTVLLMTVLSGRAYPEGSFSYAAYDGLPLVSIKVGEEKALAPQLKIKLLDIQDRRSYTGTVSGPASMNVQITFQANISTIQLHFWNMAYPSKPETTSRQGGIGNTLVVGPYRLFLVSLVPWRKAGENIESSTYVATFTADIDKDYQLKDKAI